MTRPATAVSPRAGVGRGCARRPLSVGAWNRYLSLLRYVDSGLGVLGWLNDSTVAASEFSIMSDLAPIPFRPPPRTRRFWFWLADWVWRSRPHARGLDRSGIGGVSLPARERSVWQSCEADRTHGLFMAGLLETASGRMPGARWRHRRLTGWALHSGVATAGAGGRTSPTSTAASDPAPTRPGSHPSTMPRPAVGPVPGWEDTGCDRTCHGAWVCSSGAVVRPVIIRDVIPCIRFPFVSGTPFDQVSSERGDGGMNAAVGIPVQSALMDEVVDEP